MTRPASTSRWGAARAADQFHQSCRVGRGCGHRDEELLDLSKKNIYSEKEASDNWIFNQNQFFPKDKINFIKTHNSLEKFNGNKNFVKNFFKIVL